MCFDRCRYILHVRMCHHCHGIDLRGALLLGRVERSIESLRLEFGCMRRMTVILTFVVIVITCALVVFC